MRDIGVISIIVPIYNAEKYLEECIESILGQTYEELEILLIDDGSTDRSREICDKYKNQDSRIKVFQKQNGGVSSARNMGLAKSTGNYITFVDSDDTIAKDMYECMSTYVTENIQMICCNAKRIFNNQKVSNEINDLKPAISLMSGNEAMRNCLYGRNMSFDVYTKLFKRELFFSNNKIVCFPEGRLMEEATILPEIFSKCNKIIHVDKSMYNYYIRENSYTTKPLSRECYYIYDTFLLYDEILKVHFQNIDTALEYWKVKNCLELYRTAIIQKKVIDKEVYSRIENEFKQIWFKGIRNPELSIKAKLMILETKTRFIKLRKIRQIKQF